MAEDRERKPPAGEPEPGGPPAPPAAEPGRGYGSPPAGAELKGARLSQGFTLDDVRRETGIAVNYIEAMEAGDPSHMPGRAFNQSYIRTYVRFLKIGHFFDHSEEWYVEKMEAELGAGAAARRTGGPGLWPRESTLLRGLVLAVLAAGVLAVAAGGWFGFRQVQLLEVVDPPPAAAARLAG